MKTKAPKKSYEDGAELQDTPEPDDISQPTPMQEYQESPSHDENDLHIEE